MQIFNVPRQLVKLTLKYSSSHIVIHERTHFGSELLSNGLINIWYMVMAAQQRLIKDDGNCSVCNSWLIWRPFADSFCTCHYLCCVPVLQYKRRKKAQSEQKASVESMSTDLNCVLEAVVEFHLDTPVFCYRVQDHPQEQLPQALENSAIQRKEWDAHTFVFYQELSDRCSQSHPLMCPASASCVFSQQIIAWKWAV